MIGSVPVAATWNRVLPPSTMVAASGCEAMETGCTTDTVTLSLSVRPAELVISTEYTPASVPAMSGKVRLESVCPSINAPSRFQA